MEYRVGLFLCPRGLMVQQAQVAVVVVSNMIPCEVVQTLVKEELLLPCVYEVRVPFIRV
jgi:hypothetical protein